MATKKKLLEAAAGASLAPDTGDPEFANVVLLLDGDGTSGDQNETFTDSSTNGFTVTETGSVVQGSFSPYGDNWSNSFDGNSDALTIPDSADFDFGTGDFTIECWANTSSFASAYNVLISQWGTSSQAWIFRITSSLVGLYANIGGTQTYTASVTNNLNEWNHFAVAREGSSLRFFKDGTLLGTSSISGTIANATSNVTVGILSDLNSVTAHDGYISNLRVVKGTALYTSSFTPPSTSPLTAVTNTVLLACQSNRFIDNSSSSHTLTPAGTASVTPFSPFKNDDARDITTDGGSGFVNGSGNYLSLSNSTDLKPGASGAFSAEFWYYPTGTGTPRQVMGTMTVNSYPSNVVGWDFVESPSSNIAFRWGSPSYQDTGGSSAIMKINQWNHVAVCRDAEATPTLSFFLNGARTFSTTSNTSISDASSGTFYVGYGTYTGTPIDPALGNISDARVMKGSTAYDPTQTTLTVPTSPLTAITNTKLLTNFQDAGIYDRSGINNLDTVGNARLGFAPIYGTGSLAFDGTGDYFSMPVEPHFDFGTADFTIESWVNLNATGQFNPIVYLGRDSYTGIVCDVSNSNNPRIVADIGGSWGVVATGSTALTTDQWYHLAFVRNGSSLKIYVDGVEDASATNSGSISAPSSDANAVAQIGYQRTLGGADRYFNGYLDDLRITNGVARYTSNFTPPDEIDLSTDTHREYVTLFLDGDGTVNGQNNTFTDSSTNGFTVTETGSVVQGVFSPYGDNWSNYFGGDSGLNFGDVTAVDFDANDWTMELWWNPQDLSSGDPFVFKDNVATRSFQFRHSNSSTNEIVFLFWSSNTLYNSETSNEFVYSSGFDVGEWYHIALVHDSGTFECFVNGTSIGTWTPAASNIDSGTDTLNVGYYSGGTPDYASGYLSNVRVVNGTALYTSSFTPSTTPLTAVTNTTLLTCQSNRFKDNSSNDYSVTVAGTPKVSRFSPFESDKPYDITTDGGSGFINSTGNYLSLTHSADLKPGSSGAFSIELWYYAETNSTTRQLAGDLKIISYPSNCNGFDILENNDNTVRLRWGSPTYTTIGSGASETLKAGQWHHIAVCRDAEATPTISLFVNGVRTGTTTSNTGITDSTLSSFYIGWAGSQSGTTIPPALGNICDARMLKGSTAYDPTQTTLTVPTAPLTAVTNTELLLNFQDSAIPDLSGLNNIDTAGNAKVAGTDPTKYGSNSLQLDGTGDYLELKNNQEVFDLGAGDFTVECWFYANALSATTYSTLFGFHNGGSSEWGSYVRSNGVFIYGSANTLTGAGTVSTSTWHHYAATRSGSTVRVFLNGTQVDTDTVSGSYTSSAIPFRVGIDGGINGYFNGFIDDLRITKGVARYTADFTAPDAALPKF